MNRRSILKTSLFTASSTVLFGSSTFVKNAESGLSIDSKIEENGSYLVKSGHPKNDNVFAYALFNFKNIDAVRREISQIFERNKYKTELKYSSNDRFKTEVSRQLIDFILKSDLITVDVKVFSSSTSDFASIKPSLYKEKMNSIFYGFNFNELESAELKMKKEDNFGPSSNDQEVFLGKTGKSLSSFKASEDKIFQFCDLICGNILAIVTSKKLESSVKRELATYFKNSAKMLAELKSQKTGNIMIQVSKIN